jgi:hypothetical protein
MQRCSKLEPVCCCWFFLLSSNEECCCCCSWLSAFLFNLFGERFQDLRLWFFSFFGWVEEWVRKVEEGNYLYWKRLIWPLEVKEGRNKVTLVMAVGWETAPYTRSDVIQKGVFYVLYLYSRTRMMYLYLYSIDKYLISS